MGANYFIIYTFVIEIVIFLLAELAGNDNICIRRGRKYGTTHLSGGADVIYSFKLKSDEYNRVKLIGGSPQSSDRVTEIVTFFLFL